jgi:hypothetical protein
MPASPRLSRRLKPKDHAPLVTVDDACAYMLTLPGDVAQQQSWQRAAVLALDAHMLPTRAAIGALTKQIEFALFTTGRLDL